MQICAIEYNARLQWIMVLLLTTTSQASGQEISEKLGLTSESEKRQSCRLKSITNENNMTSSTSGVLPWLLPWLLPGPGSIAGAL